MFNIGGGEFVVIALLALIVLGPQRLPEAARQVGKTMADLRRIAGGFQSELESALEHIDEPTREVIRANMGKVPLGNSPLSRGLSMAVQAVGTQGAPAAEDSDVEAPSPAPLAPAPARAAQKSPSRTRTAPKTSVKKATTRKVPASKPPAEKAPAKKAAPSRKPPAKKAPAKKAAAPRPRSTR